MPDQFSRTRLLLGEEGVKRLAAARVAIFGIGGVGSFTAEALARAGVGAFDLIDDDKICLTNLNRQIIALHSTLGQEKTEIMARRILDINPAADVRTHSCFYGADTAEDFDLKAYDYIVDAIDTISSKLLLIRRAWDAGKPVISCMGAGNKLDPTKFEVADIYQTSICPLARVMRHELRKLGVPSLKVVYSKEPPLTPEKDAGCKKGCVCPPGAARNCAMRRQIPGSISFVPSVAGLIIAGEVVKDLISAGTADDSSAAEPGRS